MHRTIASLTALALVALAGCSETPKPTTTPQVTISGHTWTVELAMTGVSRSKGLGGRTSVPEGRGMLFMYPSARTLEFWMEGCLVPLDIAFISADMKVVKIHHMPIEPGPAHCGDRIYPSGKPAQFALEVASGALTAAGIKEGDAVTFSAVPPAAKAEEEP